MERAEVVSKTEKIDKVIRDFARDLQEYIVVMQEELGNIRKSLNNLNSGWEGELYDAFKAKMLEKIKKIEAELKKASELKIRLDGTAQTYGRILKKLKEAGE